MPLSPIAQYCVRKLIRQSTDNLAHFFMPHSSHAGLSEVSINQILYKLSFSSKSKGLEIVELELLIKLYQQFESTNADAKNLIEIKRRIFQLLGFQLSTALPIEFPSIVEIEAVNPFCFYYEGQIQKGIRHKNELFGAVKAFALRQRLQAYQITWLLSEAKVPIVLTLDAAEFVLWVNVQSPTYRVLLHQDEQLLETLVHLTSIVRKGKLVIEMPQQKSGKLTVKL
jgi:hypothetical protein